MADKIKPGISVRTTFVDGESPKAAKLNSLSSQLQNASQRLEQVVGDIHSESYPYSTLTAVQLSPEYGRQEAASGALTGAPTRALDIANLGRLIGPASNLNPHQMGSQSLTETVPTGVHEFAIQYPPTDPSALVFSDTAVFTTYRASVNLLDAAGDYYVDSFGKVYSVSTTNGGTVTYTYDPRAHSGGNSYQDSSFNVIPDVNQLALGTGCSVGALDANGRRPVTLPTVTHHHYNVGGDSVTLTAADPLYGQQLYLPKILVDNWSVEEEIPGGFLYLKNYTKNKIYKNATYYYYSSTSILIGGEDITDDVNAGDVFCIITIGTDITTSIDDIRRKLHHSHDRSYGEPLIPVQALVGVLSAAGNSGVFVPSEIPGNHFPQYLHRDGYNIGTDRSKNDSNVMRGDLGIGASGGSAGSYHTTTGETFKLRFFGQGAGNDLNATSTIGRDASGNLEINAGHDGLTYYDIQTKSTLAIEEGIMGGGDVLTHVYAIKPFVILYANQTPSTGTLLLNLDGATALDTSIVPVAVQVMVKDESDTNDTWACGSPGTHEIEWTLLGPDSTFADWLLQVNLTGSAWNTSNQYSVRVLLWYLA